MNELVLEIGGIPSVLRCNQPLVLDQLAGRYRDYLIPEKAGFTLSITLLGASGNPDLHGAILEFEQDFIRLRGDLFEGEIDLAAETARLAIDSRHAFEDSEYFLRLIYAFMAFKTGGVLLHAAGVVRQAAAFLFLGHSGSGKSTSVRLSKEFTILSDDMVLITRREGQWLAASTPFWNAGFPQSTPCSAPVKGLFFLHKAIEIKLQPLPRAEALAELITNIPVVTLDPGRNDALIDRGFAILSAIQAYRLSFLRDVPFWPSIEQGLGID